MITARLTDHIWSTRKAESLNGLKLMQAEIIGGGTDTGKKIIVVDIISAGIGRQSCRNDRFFCQKNAGR